MQLHAAPQPIEKPFASGGTVTLKLSAGDYDVIGSTDNRIRIIWENDSIDNPDVDADVVVRGTQATVETDGPNGKGVDARIDLPRRSDLIVTLSAGDLGISGIEGSKDVSARAGDINISVGAPEEYRHVNASVRIGDLKADPFNVSKGGLFRSFSWTGKGSYDLRAHLTVGDLRLTR